MLITFDLFLSLKKCWWHSKKKKKLDFLKQGKNLRALLMYMIWFDPHQNPVCLIAALEQTMRLPCCCVCYSLCLKCPFPRGCWEALTDLLKPSSIMTSLGKGEVLVWRPLCPKAIISPKLLYIEGFLTITRWNVFAGICLPLTCILSARTGLLSLFPDSTVLGTC